MGNLFEKYFEAVIKAEPIRYAGHVFRVQGLLIESRSPRSVIGELCVLEVRGRELAAEVVGLDGTVVRLMAYGPTAGVETGTRVIATGAGLAQGIVATPEASRRDGATAKLRIARPGTERERSGGMRQ